MSFSFLLLVVVFVLLNFVISDDISKVTCDNIQLKVDNSIDKKLFFFKDFGDNVRCIVKDFQRRLAEKIYQMLFDRGGNRQTEKKEDKIPLEDGNLLFFDDVEKIILEEKLVKKCDFAKEVVNVELFKAEGCFSFCGSFGERLKNHFENTFLKANVRRTWSLNKKCLMQISSIDILRHKYDMFRSKFIIASRQLLSNKKSKPNPVSLKKEIVDRSSFSNNIIDQSKESFLLIKNLSFLPSESSNFAINSKKWLFLSKSRKSFSNISNEKIYTANHGLSSIFQDNIKKWKIGGELNSSRSYDKVANKPYLAKNVSSVKLAFSLVF